MYRTGFVPQQYVIDVISKNSFNKKMSNYRNEQRRIYNDIENNNNGFEVMLDEEIRNFSKNNKCSCGNYRE